MSINIIKLREYEKLKKLSKWLSSSKKNQGEFTKKMVLESNLVITEIEPAKNLTFTALAHYRIRAIVNNRKVSIVVNETESIEDILNSIMAVYYFMERNENQLAFRFDSGGKKNDC